MTTGSRTGKRRALLIVLLLIVCLPGTFAQTEKHTVSITVIRGEAVQPALSALGGVVSDTLELILRLIGGFDVVRADFLTPEVSLPISRLFFTQIKAEKAVYGDISPNAEGGYTIRVWIWSAADSENPKLIEHGIESALGVFEVADDLAVQVASAVTGQELALGTVVLKNTEQLGQFGVYVDKLPVGKNVTRFRIPAGEHELIVAQPGLLGDQPVQAFKVVVEADGTLELALEMKQAEAVREKPAAEEPAMAGPGETQKQTGTLRVTTSPPGARVLLDQQLLGLTPLELYGVPVGRYELRLERELFSGVTQLAEIRANEVTEAAYTLDVDINDPAVKGAFVTPWMSSVVAVGGLVLEGIYVYSTAGFDTGYMNGFSSSLFGYGSPAVVSLLDLGLAASLRFGHFAAGDTTTGATIALIDMGAVAVSKLLGFWNSQLVQQEGQNTTPSALRSFLNTASPIVFVAAIILSSLYDVALAPLAATKTNERVLETIKSSGSLPLPPSYPQRSLFIEAGAGALASVGYRFGLIRDYLYVDALAAASLTSLSPMQIGPSISARISGYPFGSATGPLRLYVSVGASAETDFISIGLSISPAVGYDLKLPWFDIYSVSSLAFGLLTGTRTIQFGIGVRI
jgi:hypothetical protein